jgi:DNA-binding Xre family transcriptional regulator
LITISFTVVWFICREYTDECTKITDTQKEEENSSLLLNWPIIIEKLRTLDDKLGEFLNQKAIIKAEIARRTGITKQRMTDITTNTDVTLRADEVLLIARAIQVDPRDVLEYVCGHLVREAVSPLAMATKLELYATAYIFYLFRKC